MDTWEDWKMNGGLESYSVMCDWMEERKKDIDYMITQLTYTITMHLNRLWHGRPKWQSEVKSQMNAQVKNINY